MHMLLTPSCAVSSEVGVFSSPNGKTDWKYHGIVVARGQPGGWDAGGVASPGAAVGAVAVSGTSENVRHLLYVRKGAYKPYTAVHVRTTISDTGMAITTILQR